MPATCGLLLHLLGMEARDKKQIRLLAITSVPANLSMLSGALDALAVSPGFRLDHVLSLEQGRSQCQKQDYELIIIDPSVCGPRNRERVQLPIRPRNSPVVVLLHQPTDCAQCANDVIKGVSCALRVPLDCHALTITIKQLCQAGLLASGPCPPGISAATAG